MNSSEQIREIIEKAIEEKKLTAKDCLVACNMSKSFLSNWKSGRSQTPTYTNILKLAEFLEINLDYLFFGTKQIVNMDELVLNDAERELVVCFRSLDTFNQGLYLGEMRAKAKELQKSMNAK